MFYNYTLYEVMKSFCLASLIRYLNHMSSSPNIRWSFNIDTLY